MLAVAAAEGQLGTPTTTSAAWAGEDAGGHHGRAKGAAANCVSSGLSPAIEAAARVSMASPRCHVACGVDSSLLAAASSKPTAEVVQIAPAIRAHGSVDHGPLQPADDQQGFVGRLRGRSRTAANRVLRFWKCRCDDLRAGSCAAHPMRRLTQCAGPTVRRRSRQPNSRGVQAAGRAGRRHRNRCSRPDRGGRRPRYLVQSIIVQRSRRLLIDGLRS